VRELSYMNESGENIRESVSEVALQAISDGFIKLRNLELQKARGANVDEELEIVKTELSNILHNEIGALGQMAVVAEYGDMDPERFTQPAEGPAYLRKE